MGLDEAAVDVGAGNGCCACMLHLMMGGFGVIISALIAGKHGADIAEPLKMGVICVWLEFVFGLGYLIALIIGCKSMKKLKEKGETEIIKFSELESLPKTSFSSETIQDSELSQLLVEAIRDFETGKNLKVMVMYLPTLKAGEEEENLFSSQQMDQLRRKQILPWFITSSLPQGTITLEHEAWGVGLLNRSREKSTNRLKPSETNCSAIM